MRHGWQVIETMARRGNRERERESQLRPHSPRAQSTQQHKNNLCPPPSSGQQEGTALNGRDMLALSPVSSIEQARKTAGLGFAGLGCSGFTKPSPQRKDLTGLLNPKYAESCTVHQPWAKEYRPDLGAVDSGVRKESAKVCSSRVWGRLGCRVLGFEQMSELQAFTVWTLGC